MRRDLWQTLNRVPRDPRLRRGLLSIVGALAYVVYLLRAYVHLALWESLAWATAMGISLVSAALLSRSFRRRDGTLVDLAGPPSPASPQYPAHRARIEAALLTIAALVDRAGVELMHRQGRLRPELAGTTRRRALDVARGADWDRLSPHEQDLLLSPEGTWSESDTWSTVFCIEQVRVLRWVLCVDPVLLPLEFAELDMRPALEVTSRPERATGTLCREPSDLRAAKMITRQMLDRLVAEGARRGFFKIECSSTRARLLELAERMRAPGSQDLLIGATAIADATEEKVRMLAQIALRRGQILAELTAYLSGPPEAELRIRGAAESLTPETAAPDAS